MKPDTPPVSVPALHLLASATPISIARHAGVPIEDRSARSFLRALMALPEVTQVRCTAVLRPNRAHLFRIDLTVSAAPNWLSPALEPGGPFYAEPAPHPPDDGPCQWHVCWNPPHQAASHTATDPGQLSARLAHWSAQLKHDADCRFPFVPAPDFFAGEAHKQSVELPTWPRALTFTQARAAVTGMSRLPGVDAVLIEVDPAPRGALLAHDLAVRGQVDVADVIEYWRTLGLAGADKRIAPVDRITVLGRDPGQWSPVGPCIAIWTSRSLAPCFLRHDANPR